MPVLWVPLFRVLAASLQVSEETAGSFDVTIGLGDSAVEGPAGTSIARACRVPSTGTRGYRTASGRWPPARLRGTRQSCAWDFALSSQAKCGRRRVAAARGRRLPAPWPPAGI